MISSSTSGLGGDTRGAEMVNKGEKMSVFGHEECFLLPWSDGLTMPLLAKRASSAGGRGILLGTEGRFSAANRGQRSSTR